MTPDQNDIEAVKLALKRITEDELPKRLILTQQQHELLQSLLEFAAMVAAAKKFGVPVFNLAVTLAGAWLAIKAFILGGAGK